MAKQKVVITQSYQQVATGKATITVEKRGTGALYLDEASNDATAYKIVGDPGEQFQQTEALSTFVRATGDGWEIIVDGAL